MENPLQEEAADFAAMMENGNQAGLSALTELAETVSKTSFAMRQTAGVVYPADNN